MLLPVNRTLPELLMKSLFMLALLCCCIAPANCINGDTPEKLQRSPTESKVRTVVIDAGHGGKDPGCHGSFAHEKDICLAISLKLGKMIEDHYSDVKVVYTRKTDVFIELHNRAKIANDADADLFICIHVNAGGDARPYGAETYVMGLHRTETNLAVAKRENESILLEENYQKQYEGFDPNSVEGSIIFSLYQNRYLTQSLSFAAMVQEYFKDYAGRHDRGVRQAGFLVLVYTAMPSVLIETGFATNPSEEKFLADKYGQLLMAESIFQAFSDYKKSVEKTGYSGMKKAFVPTKGTGKKEEKTEEPVEKPVIPGTDEIVFKVQFLSSRSKLALGSAELKQIEDVSMDESEGWFRYFSGNEKDLDKITLVQNSVRDKGYKDAFVVAFKGNQRISVKEALQFINKKN